MRTFSSDLRIRSTKVGKGGGEKREGGRRRGREEGGGGGRKGKGGLGLGSSFEITLIMRFSQISPTYRALLISFWGFLF